MILNGLPLLARILILLWLLKQLQLLLRSFGPVVERIVVFELVSVDNLLTVRVDSVQSVKAVKDNVHTASSVAQRALIIILIKLIFLVIQVRDISIVLVLIWIILLDQGSLRQQWTYTLINVISSIQSWLFTLNWINSWVVTSLSSSLVVVVLGLLLLNYQLIVTLFVKCPFCDSFLLTSEFFIASLDSTFDQSVIERVVETLSNIRQAMSALGLILIRVFAQISVLSIDLVLILFYLTLWPSLFRLILIILPHQQIIIAYLNLLFILRVILIPLYLSLHMCILRLSIAIEIPIRFQNALLQLHVFLTLRLIVLITRLFVLPNNIQRLECWLHRVFCWRIISL